MCSRFKKICCLLSVLFISSLCYSQRQFHITVEFVPKLDTNNIRVIMDVGTGYYMPPVVIENGKIDIICKVYSKYAFISISLPSTSIHRAYLITKESSSIIFYWKNKSDKDYPFTKSKFTNAIDLYTCKEIKSFQKFTQKEFENFTDFSERYQLKLKTNDSLMSIYNQKEKVYVNKELEFIKIHSKEYFSLWCFGSFVKSIISIEADSLLQFYKEVLYPKYSNLFEAKQILNYLKNLAICQSIKLNQPAPDFTTTDITGRKFSLSQLKGKYVLINIWATWCGPCVEELPLFKKLRDDFPEDQLEMISISEDKTKADLENGIKKYGLNWTHIFSDSELINKYQISSAVPITFLIDKEGRLVFKIVGGLPNTDELRKLLMKK